MSDSDLIQGIVLTHGNMGQGMVDAVRRIAGDRADGLRAMTNQGTGPNDLRSQLDAMIDGKPTVIFTDLQSGSCALTARRCCAADAEVGGHDLAVMFGVNLPMLLDFVFHRDMPLQVLLGRVLEKGRAGVQGFLADGSHGDSALQS